MFIEELIEKLKTGSVWCWTRGGWCVEVITHIPNNIEPFQAYQMRWYATGKYYAGVCEDGRDLIAICRNPKLIQEEFLRDTQRQPVAGDWVVILDAKYSKHLIGKVVQIDTTNGTHINIEGTQNFHIDSLLNQTHLRFATPEEIAVAQQAIPPPPTQPNEQACSSLIVVCRGLETTKGTT